MNSGNTNSGVLLFFPDTSRRYSVTECLDDDLRGAVLVDNGTHNDESDKEEKADEWPSVDDAKPIEEGGPDARKGFNYQDEIAVSFLLDMMEDQSIVKDSLRDT